MTRHLAVMASAQCGPNVLPFVGNLVTAACAEGGGIEVPNTTIWATNDLHDGWHSLIQIGVGPHIDAMIFFGQTAASAGLDEHPPFAITTVLIPHQVFGTRAIKLPSPMSSWWRMPESVNLATSAVADLLTTTVDPRPLDLAVGTFQWN